jgi:hypothetical protein
MNFEELTFQKREKLKPDLEIEVKSGYESFISEEFRKNPMGYFETKGVNIKTGEIKRDDAGVVKEDPSAVKELPVWTDKDKKELRVIGKRVNVEKGKVGESGDPFYEYKMIEIVRNVGLPAPKLVAKVEQQGVHLILTEKVTGIGWYEKNALKLKERGYGNEDVDNLKQEAEKQMNELKEQFEEAGIIRDWKLKDMIFDIDIENKKIKNITPTDFERTKIDQPKLDKYKKKNIKL